MTNGANRIALARDERAERLRLFAIALPALAVIGATVIAPILKVLFLSLLDADGQISLANYATLASEGANLTVIATTLKVSLIVTVVSVLIGYPLTYFLVQIPRRVAALCLVSVVLPYLTSVLVRTYAWMVLLGRRGILNNTLSALGVIDDPLPLMFNTTATVIGMVHMMLPLLVLPLYGAMRAIDTNCLRAAASLGAGPIAAFLEGLVPAFAAGPGRRHVPDLCDQPWIFHHADCARRWSRHHDRAADRHRDGHLQRLRCRQRSWGRLAGRNRNNSVRRREAHPRRSHGPAMIGATHLGRLWLYAFAAAALAFLILPTLLIVPMSFTATSFLQFPPPAWSFRWYRAWFGNPEWVDATIISFQAATLTMLFAAPLGFAAAYATRAAGARAARALAAVLTVPMLMPAILIGIGLYLVYVPLGLNNSIAGLVLAHTSLTIPYAYVIMLARLRDFDPRQELAARSLGCTRLRAFLSVTLPQVRASAIAAALLAFIFSFDEGVVAYFIATGSASTLPRRMFLALQFGVDPTIAAISSGLILLTVVVAAASQLAQTRGREGGEAT
jgi:ABC-type spermidine/putrescine transport system permease subunit II